MNTTVNQPQPKKKLGIGKIILIVIGAFFVLGVIANLGGDKKAASAEGQSNTSAIGSNAAKEIAVGQTLQTQYFAVMVSKVSVVNKVNTDNQFSDLKSEPGTKYLILDVTFKNTDSESRMLTDGEVHITYNGKDYNFDKSETIMAEGYGLFLDQINPLTQKSTKLVYKLPEEINGVAYYNPGRASGDELISLGNIK